MEALPAPPGAPVVGSRVADAAGSRGTVRYVGPVCVSRDQSAVYFGVEWDDSTRGKHSGSVQNAAGETVTYFSTAVEGAGSFVKINKLAARKSVTAALQERYGAGADGGSAAESELYANTASGNHLQIQVVGMDLSRQQQALETIHEAALRGMNVCGPDAETTVAELAPHITYLDLQQNLLHDWGDVAAICAQVPLLQTLQLSDNRMTPPPPLSSLPEGAFGALRVLVLNATRSSWAELCALAPALPGLGELHACDNGITELFTGEEGPAVMEAFAGLHTLNLSDNALGSWAHVQTLSTLPELQRLLLNGNPLPAIEFEAPEAAGFAALESISLSGTAITAWESIDRLGWLRELATLRFSHVPLSSGMGSSEARQILIARMPFVASINGSAVRAKERVDAEKAYLKRILSEIAAAQAAATGGPEETRTRVLAAHPQYETLVERHGLPQAGASADGSSNLASSMVAVTLQDISANASPSQQKRLPSTFTVGNLKRLFTRMTNLEPEEQHLLYRAPDDPLAMPTWLDDETKTLSYYGVVDGGTLAVQELDREQAARDAALEAERAQEQMDKQMAEADMRSRLRQHEIEQERAGATGSSS